MYRVLMHMDSDGHASAGVVCKYLLERGVPESEIACHPVNYGLNLPAEIDYEKDTVYMVDFSLQPDMVMLDFAAKLGTRFTWIDHHDTSVQLEKRHPVLQRLPGMRRVAWNKGTPISGCELTWRCLFRDKEMPSILRVVGDWDVWRWPDLSEKAQEDVKSLQYYLRNNATSPEFADGRTFWLDALNNATAKLDPRVLQEGRLLLHYQTRQWRSMVKNASFEADFAGLKALMVNAKGNSDMFAGVFDPKKHDVMITFQLIRGQFVSVSLYRGPSDNDVHLGELAEKLGRAGDIPSGGGHPGAAGFQCSWDYFKTLFEVSVP